MARELSERHPVLRSGERDPIDPYKRRLIYERDGYACRFCGWGTSPDSHAPGTVLQLDHIIPWSARGSDRSDNLRSLCGPCNEERSNFKDLFPMRIIGVTRECFWCAKRHGHLPDRYLGADTADLDRVRVHCGRCGTTSWVPDESWVL